MIPHIRFGLNYLWNNLLLGASVRFGRTLVKPCQIYVILTEDCNFNCPMCRIKDGGRTLPKEYVINLLDQMKSWGIARVTFGGGEPMLLGDDFLDILKYANGHGLLSHFTTNASLLDEPFLRAYNDSGGGQISVSLDAADEALHDKLRGAKGAFKSVMNALELYKRVRPRKITFKILSVISNQNLEELPRLVEVARRYGVPLFFQPYDPQDYDVLDPALSIEEIRAKFPLWIHPKNLPALRGVLDDLLRLRRTEPDTILNSEDNLETIYAYFSRNLDFSGKCLVGFTSLFILPSGNITMCLYGDLGDSLQMPLKALWKSEPFEKARRQMLECRRPCLEGCARRLSSPELVREGLLYFWRKRH